MRDRTNGSASGGVGVQDPADGVAPPARRWRGRWEAATWGVVGPVAFITAWIVAGLLRDGYSFMNDAISRLAEHGAPNRWIVTTGIAIISSSSILLGVLIGVRWKAKVAAVVTVIAGVSALGLGIFSCSPGCPGIGGEFTDKMHSTMAVIHYIAFGLSPLLVAFSTRRITPKVFRACSIFAAVFGGAFLVAQFTGWGPNGLTQRIGLTTLDLWMLTTALTLTRPETT